MSTDVELFLLFLMIRGRLFQKQCSSVSKKKKIPPKNICSIATDGASAMLGVYSGFHARLEQAILQDKGSVVIKNHCCLHRTQLATSDAPDILLHVLDHVKSFALFLHNSCIRDLEF